MTDRDRGDTPGRNHTSENAQAAGERQKTFSRRALLEAGWTVPLIAAVHFPTDAYAVSVPAHQDSTGTSHSDGIVPHEDTGGTPMCLGTMTFSCLTKMHSFMAIRPLTPILATSTFPSPSTLIFPSLTTIIRLTTISLPRTTTHIKMLRLLTKMILTTMMIRLPLTTTRVTMTASVSVFIMTPINTTTTPSRRMMMRLCLNGGP